jgi:hypothetical protein
LFLKRNTWLLVGTFAVAVLFAVVPFFVSRDPSKWPPSLGDWGDYLGGAMALIVFLWLVAGHLENQRQIADANRDMETQLELTREVAGALATIAAGSKVQAQEALARAAPLFVFLGSTGEPLSRHTVAARPMSGYFSFRNDGSHVTFTGVRVTRPELRCRIEGGDQCGPGDTFKIRVASEQPLKGIGPIEMIVTYEDKFKISRWARITARSFEGTPDIDYGTGQPDQG